MTLARLFETALGANLSSSAEFSIPSARVFDGRGVLSSTSAMLDDEDSAKVGVGKGFISAAVDGRLLLLSSREPGRLNGSSRRGGIINVISFSVTDEPGNGAVEGLA